MAKSGANGVVRNVHLKPRPVMLAATEFGDQIRHALALGDRGRHQRHRGVIRAEHGGDVILGDQAHGLLLADLRIALVIGFVELDLGAAEIGQAGGGAERQVFQLGMRGVDDLGGEVDGVLGRLAGARRVAGQRIDDADLHVIGRLCGAADGDRQHCSGDGRYPHCSLPTSFVALKPDSISRLLRTVSDKFVGVI